MYSLIAQYERMPKSAPGGNYVYDFPEYEGTSELYNNSNIKTETISLNEKYDLEGNIYK